MTIQQKPNVEDFIDRAPDAEAESSPPGQREGKKQITVTMDPALVRKVDELARRMGQTRSAMVSLLVFEALEKRND